MRDLKLTDLMNLVVAGVRDPERRIQQLYEWQFQKRLVIIKSGLALSGALFVSLIVALLKKDLDYCWWQNIGILFSSLVPAILIFIWMVTSRSPEKHYIAALKLFSKLNKSKTFVALVLGEPEGKPESNG